MAIITKHAERRLKQRCGIGKKSSKRMVSKIFKNGIKHSQTTGALNKWVTSLFFKHKTANNIRIHGDKAYIFCGETLVTVIPIPNELKVTYKNMITKGS